MASLVIQQSEKAITPFWQRLPLFFRYPFHFEHLIYMVGLSVVPVMALMVPFLGPLTMVVALLGIWLAFIRHAYKTLDYTAQGILDPELYHLHYDDSDERKNLPYKQFGIMVVMGVAVGIAAAIGSLMQGLVLIFVTLAFPATVMILTLTRSFSSAVHPGNLFGLMRAIGLPYLGLWAFLFLLSASQQVMTSFLANRISPFLALPLLNFVAMYFTLIMFNMMGYVIYQYHVPLGVPVRMDLEATPEEEAKESVADIIGRLVGAGDIDGALEVADKSRRETPGDLAAQERYYKLLVLADRKQEQLVQGRPYLTALLQKGRDVEALKLFQSLREMEPAYSPEQATQFLKLAEAARRQRQFDFALNLVKGFDKRFPGHADIPAVYFFAAKVLSENFKQDASARRLLDALLQRYPDHPVGAEARQYLAVLDKLGQAGAVSPRPEAA